MFKEHILQSWRIINQNLSTEHKLHLWTTNDRKTDDLEMSVVAFRNPEHHNIQHPFVFK